MDRLRPDVSSKPGHGDLSSHDDLNVTFGVLAAIGVVLIWSSWLVISRAAALTPLTPYDLTAIRYGISAIFGLPIVLYFKPWRQMTLLRIITITVLLGPVYVLLIFSGFQYAPASHGGIFMNGTLPIFTFLIGWLWLSQRPTGVQALASLVILTGVILTIGDATFDFGLSWPGDLMFVGAAVLFCLYMTVSRLWNVTATQVLLCSAILNAILFVPIWYFFLPSGIAETTPSQFWLQALFQGLVPNLAGLLLIAVAARNIGPAATATFMSTVPALGALLGFIFLGEEIGWVSWVGLSVLTIGIFLMTKGRKKSIAALNTIP